jgi:hypothetical protein
MAVPAVSCHPHIAQPTVTPSSARRPTITNAVFMRSERSLSGSRSDFDANLRAFEGPDNKLFEAYRELLEQVASDAFDAGEANEAGCVLVTKEALN